MKTVVFAYAEMGCAGISALLNAGYEISAIFTHSDTGTESHFFDSVARLAAEQGIPVYAPEDVNHPLWVDRIKTMAPDYIFSFYYRALLNDSILSCAKLGARPRYLGSSEPCRLKAPSFAQLRMLSFSKAR